ncbi:MAG: hypothetical protein KDA58_15185, partial [Planctomycetaceae bacterium]|nr:hypothetical protein [Planctomycetaceae bacterium]
MTIRVRCPKCGFRFQLAAEDAGKKGVCPREGCNQKFRVPAAKVIARHQEQVEAQAPPQEIRPQRPPTAAPVTESLSNGVPVPLAERVVTPANLPTPVAEKVDDPATKRSVVRGQNAAREQSAAAAKPA